MRRLPLKFLVVALLVGPAANILSAQDALTEQIDAMTARLKKAGAKRIVENGAKASFSPDGKRIVYGKMPFGAGISLLDLESGKSTDLVEPGKDPAFSSGEKPLIAYVRGNLKEEEVWVIEPDGRNDRKIGAGGFPTWSGDGKTLYFHTRDRLRLMAVDISAEDPQPVERDLVIPQWYPAVSPDGKTVAYVSQGTFVVTPIEKPSYTARLLPGLTRGGLAGWSSDGKQVGYGGFGYDDRVGLWVYETETGKTRQIVDGPCTMPAWSKDGSKLIFDFRAARNRHEVWMIDTGALETDQVPKEQ